MDLDSHPASAADATPFYPPTWHLPGKAANDDAYTSPTLTVGEVLPLAPPLCRDPLANLPSLAGIAGHLILAFPPLIARGTSRKPAVLSGFPELTAAILRRLPPEQSVHVHWLPEGCPPFSLPMDAILTPLSSNERLALALPHQELLLGTANASQVQLAGLLQLSTSVISRQMAKLQPTTDAANDPMEASDE
jgi:hypothetical protein